MAKYPEIQEKVREEVQNVDSFMASDFNPEKLPWLCAVHSEVLRLNAPVQTHYRRCVKDVEINGIKGWVVHHALLTEFFENLRRRYDQKISY